ncbi:hypothetical protein NDU88_006177 [Pleurodeles waltl]|uniref:Uncharacterized protein n=1 Tax=Pleurodeles waltl TaxID=8319 RepID=A0AAV7QN82_PLEWA|nr:hypothetical protein NDU88_006177 [Pleurodeles waltl]
MEPDPREAEGHNGEGHRVYPGVGEDGSGILVAHLGLVTQREDHSDPAVYAEGCHAEHGVGGQKSLQEAYHEAQTLAPRGTPVDDARKGQGHVEHCHEQVAEGQVEDEEAGHLLADVGAGQEADQHQEVGQQRCDDHHHDQEGGERSPQDHGGGCHSISAPEAPGQRGLRPSPLQPRRHLSWPPEVADAARGLSIGAEGRDGVPGTSSPLQGRSLMKAPELRVQQERRHATAQSDCTRERRWQRLDTKRTKDLLHLQVPGTETANRGKTFGSGTPAKRDCVCQADE